LAPSALAGLVYLAIRVRALETLFALQQPHPMDNPLITLSGLERWATALGLVARYLRLLLYPLGLSADYSGPVIPVEHGLLRPLPVIGTLVLLVCLALVLRPLWRRPSGRATRLWAFAALLFLLPYLVIGNLLVTVGTIFAERLLYFPSSGFCFMAGLLLGAIASGRFQPSDAPQSGTQALIATRLPMLALAAWVAAFALMTWNRSHAWLNDETVFSAAAAVQPRSPRAHYVLGKMLADRNELDAALERFERTTDLYPAHVSAWNEKGVVHGRREAFPLAERMFREAVRLSPSHADAHLNLGIALHRQRRMAEAERSVRRALLWDNGSAAAWAELGNLLLDRRRNAQAAAAYRRALALGHDDVRDRLRRAEALAAAPTAP
jgi:tetratricopeptide (TPR) repeat protein